VINPWLRKVGIEILSSAGFGGICDPNLKR
jgi:hypothetical protein